MDESQIRLKNCPFCAEQIKSDAILCRYCQSSLLDHPSKSDNEVPNSPIKVADNSDLNTDRAYSASSKRKKTLFAVAISLTALVIASLIASSVGSSVDLENENKQEDVLDESQWVDDYKQWSLCMEVAISQGYPNPSKECESLEP